jgi:hypothetical protein
MFLYQEDDDHQRLTTDPTIYTPSSDGRLFVFLPYSTGIAPGFRRDATIVGPCLMFLNTVSASGYGGAATPPTAGPATTTTTECSWDATDNGDTDLDAAAVEEVALGAGRSAHAHFI